MSKLACKCGNVIRDQTDNLPYKGVILRDQHASLSGKAADSVADYVKARLRHTEKEWMRAYFGKEYGKSGLSDANVVRDLIAFLFARGVALDMYQCEACQRVLIEDRHDPNHFFSFAPEDENAINILRVNE